VGRFDAASAVVIAKEYGAALKVIWREEDGCGDDCGNPGFNSTWPDLFSEPKLRLADNFPGMHLLFHACAVIERLSYQTVRRPSNERRALLNT
jgi:hypothetical protein